MTAFATRISILALAALPAACTTYGPQGYPPGTRAETVMQGMGPPTGEYPLPGGGRRLEYARGPFARHTYMLDFDAGGQLLRFEQVLTEARFNAIKAGMSAQQVREQIGRPSTTWPIPRQHQLVWSYRYESPFCQWFMVGMGPGDQVVDTAYGPDPVCDDDNFFDRMMRVR